MCPEGFFCPREGLSEEIVRREHVCPAGLHCPNQTAVIPNSELHACPKGSYCLQGNLIASPIPCPEGTFSDLKGLKFVHQCQDCPPDFFCDKPGMKKVTEAQRCPAGYICPRGSSNSKANPCPIGFYRPKGDPNSPPSARSLLDCVPCRSGHFCDKEGLSQMSLCLAGHYCPPGTVKPQPCPLGTYNPKQGKRTSGECLPCKKGSYCASTGLANVTGPCDAGFYCSRGAYSRRPAKSNYGGPCALGGFCPEGSGFPQACKEGSYVPNTGASSETECRDCQPGYFCPGKGTTNAFSLKCKAGFYCIGKSATATQKKSKSGFYSKKGAMHATPCPPGQQSREEASECSSCPVGFFCTSPGTVKPSDCPYGAFCPLSSIVPTRCRRGSFNPDKLKTIQSDCLACEAGKACSQSGLRNPDGLCAPGFACNGERVTSRYCWLGLQ